jgi:hypothetical protein
VCINTPKGYIVNKSVIFWQDYSYRFFWHFNVVTSNFVATNNEVFKILKDMADFYLQYKKTAIENKCNQITLLNGFFSKN